MRSEVFSHFLTHRSSNTTHQSGSLFLCGSGSLVNSTQVTGCLTFTAILQLAQTHTHTLICSGTHLLLALFTLTYIGSHRSLPSGRNAHTDVTLHLSDFDTEKKR